MASRPSLRLFVANLPWTISKKELREYFSNFGRVSFVDVLFDKGVGLSRGIGFVQFTSHDAVKSVLRTPNLFLEGHFLTVSESVRRNQSEN